MISFFKKKNNKMASKCFINYTCTRNNCELLHDLNFENRSLMRAYCDNNADISENTNMFCKYGIICMNDNCKFKHKIPFEERKNAKKLIDCFRTLELSKKCDEILKKKETEPNKPKTEEHTFDLRKSLGIKKNMKKIHLIELSSKCLKEIAKKRKIKNYSKKTKDELIELL